VTTTGSTSVTSTATVKACVSKKTGLVRVARKCRKGERRRVWNVRGPVGAQGLAGEPGVKGDKGDPGQNGLNGVQGLTPGVYLHHPQLGAVELLREGVFREQAARLAADQRYAGDAHVNLYYLAHLPSILARYGNRGYRLAQLEGALQAGKLHLATHALGLGAVGSTAYDDEVIRFFSPHAAGKAYGFVTVFGKRRRIPR